MQLPTPKLCKTLKDEDAFRDWYNAILRQLGFWIYTIRNVETLTLKPFDSIGSFPDWLWLAIEYKMINHKKSNVRKALRPHQRKNLKEFTWKSVVIVYNRKDISYRIFDINEIADEQIKIF